MLTSPAIFPRRIKPSGEIIVSISIRSAVSLSLSVHFRLKLPFSFALGWMIEPVSRLSLKRAPHARWLLGINSAFKCATRLGRPLGRAHMLQGQIKAVSLSLQKPHSIPPPLFTAASRPGEPLFTVITVKCFGIMGGNKPTRDATHDE